MNYAPDTYSRNDSRSKRRKATRPASANRLLRKRVATPQRPQRNPQGQTAVRTQRPLADGFLKNRFLPKLAVNPDMAKLTDKKVTQRERDFYRSLSQLALHYGFTPMQTACYPYPYNFTLALWDAQKQIGQSDKGENFDRLQLLENNSTEQVFLAVTERYDTGQNLYYIPVIPLYKMMKDRKRKHTAHLLLPVFTYLDRIAALPFYREEHTFLYWQYEMLNEWAMQDDDSEENRGMLSELRQAERLGEQMSRKIADRENLTLWKQRTETFKAKDGFDNEVCKLTASFLELYSQYPDRTVFKHTATVWDKDEYEYDEEETSITMDKYIGFIADDRGLLYEQLCESVNSEFSQYTDMEEPTVTHYFDGTPTDKNKLDFENRLFPLIAELSYLLHRYNTHRI
jgi:hypothetical protein